jgi:hypothetical protein
MTLSPFDTSNPVVSVSKIEKLDCSSETRLNNFCFSK